VNYLQFSLCDLAEFLAGFASKTLLIASEPLHLVATGMQQKLGVMIDRRNQNR
jgi:hypothetical protein